jgi:3-hydroxymyristoyl/3-hydroxydecanoyl-(acyl carrier protein) dehydratase
VDIKDQEQNIVFCKMPHDLLKTAPPFLFVDKVHEFNKEEQSLICSKQVGYNEPYFAGHFPGDPIVPGVLITEMAVQASALLLTAINNTGYEEGYLVRTKDFSFYNAVRPGSCLMIRVKFLEQTGSFVTTKALVTFQGEKTKVAKGEVVLFLR